MKHDAVLMSTLRRHGFRRTYLDRHPQGGLATYSRTFGDRTVDVQLWPDGKHRVSHWLGGRMSTVPTDFTDLTSMLGAILHELTRTDQPPVK